MQKRVVICDHIHEKGLMLLKGQDDLIVDDLSGLSKKELLEQISLADGLITRSSTPVNEDLLINATNLKAIVRAGVGVDNVDIESCSKRGVVVMNVPTSNTIAAVELTLAHILNCIRRYPGANSQLKNEKKWNREDWYGTELKDKKLGIIGFGNIGSRVGIRAKSFDMNIVVYDPYINSSKVIDLGMEYTKQLDDILQCDIITIHTPKNNQTVNMIDKEQIAKMKDGVVLINCARGGLYNEDALYEALKSKKIAFAGLDVFNKEPAIDNKLLDLENVYVTPHIGANTFESQEKISVDAATAMISALKGSSYPNALNLPIKTTNMPSYIYSYLELAQKLGFFISQAVDGAISSISVCIQGEDLEAYKESLQVFAIVGALRHSLGDNINFVNAMFEAQNRNISLLLNFKKVLSPYKNYLAITIGTQKESMSAGGVVYDENIIRFTNVNNFDIDLEPKGNMILVRNTDVPGVIGDIGNTIAKHNVNIADFRLGRGIKHSDALALIIVDNSVSKELLRDLRSIKECTSVRSVYI